MLRALCRAALAVSVVLVLGASVAWAHPGITPGAPGDAGVGSTVLPATTPMESLSAVHPATLDARVISIVAVAMMLAASIPRGTWRRAAVFALVALVATFSVETAVHSVHHLDRERAGACVIAAASVHIVGDVPSPVAVVLPFPAPAERIASSAPPSIAIPRHAPDHGRAPPA